MSGSGTGVRRGRHRKPSNTNKAIARTVMAGAVVGAPLATAGTAQAASDNTWDRVAQCESGGNWTISTGNGFQGGLQFTQSTWRSFGGTRFASSANRASREQQIAVAEKVLAGQGWGAWPVCSRKAHATGEAATPRVVTARSIGTRTDRTQTTTGRHALRPATPPRTAVTAQPPAAAAVPVVQLAPRLRPLADPAPAATAASLPLTALPLAPAPAAAPAPRTAPAISAIPVPAPARPAPAAVPAPRAVPAPAGNPAPTGPTVLAAAPAPAAPRVYEVKEGDTLAGIARAEHVTGGWQQLYATNRAGIGDANLIRPGEHLTIT